MQSAYSIPFAKYEGLGNDFIVIDERAAPTAARFIRALDGPTVAGLCDRHRGIGADGILPITFEHGAARMRVWNADGSIAEMCGNGLRCVAFHLAADQAAQEFSVDTDAGPHRCVVTRGAGRGEADVTIDMHPAVFEPEKIPVGAREPMIDHLVKVAQWAPKLTAVSIGNPHAVIFGLEKESHEKVGTALQESGFFPEGVNVGFAHVCSPTHLELSVLERGVGFTHACGTGACAAAAAAVETGRSPRRVPIRVDLPGGTLEVTVGEPGARIRMKGPARFVFDGTLRIDPKP